jgi:glycosidase
VRADVFEGHESLVALDHDSPAVVEWVAEVMDHWLARGVDGWRLDAAYAVPPAFWAQVLPSVRERHPDAWFLGEVIHGDAARFVRDSTIDSLTAYELWQGIWHGIADRNLFELAHAVQRHSALLETSVPATFVGNHDVTRIASAVGPELVPHALAVLFTVGGVPSVYAGDEDGAMGVKEERLGGDDAVRPELAPTPPRADELDETARRIREVHQQLIGLRRREPWLVSARADVVHTANEQLVLRSGRDDAAVVVALNLADEEVTLPCPDATEVVAGAGQVEPGAQVRLGPRGWAVLRR